MHAPRVLPFLCYFSVCCPSPQSDPSLPVLVAGDPERASMKRVKDNGGIFYHQSLIAAMVCTYQYINSCVNEYASGCSLQWYIHTVTRGVATEAFASLEIFGAPSRMPNQNHEVGHCNKISSFPILALMTYLSPTWKCSDCWLILLLVAHIWSITTYTDLAKPALILVWSWREMKETWVFFAPHFYSCTHSPTAMNHFPVCYFILQ